VQGSGQRTAGSSRTPGQISHRAGLRRDGSVDGAGTCRRNRGTQPAGSADPRDNSLRSRLLVRSIHRAGELANVSLRNFFVFHMDECLDWQARPLPRKHPYNFRSFMETHFYGGIRPELQVPGDQRFWLLPSTLERVRVALDSAPIDLTIGGWGQDGHLAYNQARRQPYSRIRLEELANSSIRIQENNLDTILALAQRTFGSAYQFVPPMSITLGIRECLSAKKVRVYSDTGSWKQTALRVALFSEPVAEYPITLLQRHPDAVITATQETARHPISENPDWELF